jgi:hypothetical protein
MTIPDHPLIAAFSFERRSAIASLTATAACQTG